MSKTDPADEDTESEGADPNEQSTMEDGAPLPGRPPLGELVSPSVFEDPATGRLQRYEIGGVLGQGGTGRVYVAYDRDLNREVAIKVIHRPNAEQLDRFVGEARVMASLGHPNVPPLYDVGRTNDALYLTMPHITGRSLGAWIRDAVSDNRSELAPLASLIEIMLKLCDAVAFAHARGIIHQDIKPDNVMIGAYGEVMLVDWGAAATPLDAGSPEGRVVGTPAYMAPEQARGDPPNKSSDIYALGATLFHALLLRKPVIEPDPDRFWQRKRDGDIDSPSSDELARVPRPVLSVALKAMSSDVTKRYSSVVELADALRGFQAGRNVWAAPLVGETFLDDGYLERWTSIDRDDFVREPGRLVSQRLEGALLFYKKRLPAGVAVEYDGEILDEAWPGDLSVIWTEEDVFEGGPHWPREGTQWRLQIAGFSNLLVGIFRGRSECVSGRSLSIEIGRKYRIRAEINEQNLRLMLDGEVVAEYEDLFPLPSGYLALYSYNPRKAFSNLRLYERGMPHRVSPIAIGDAFFVEKDYEKAARHYARVEQLLPLTAVAEEARYKRGLSLLSAGAKDAARRAWRGLGDEAWRARAALYDVDAAFSEGRHDHVVGELARLLQSAPSLRSAVINRWAQYVTKLCQSNAFAIEPYARLREAEFSSHVESASAAASAGVALGRWHDVVERFSDQHLQYVDACNLLGRFEHVVTRYANVTWMRDMALLRLNRYDAPELTPKYRQIALLLRAAPLGPALDDGDLTAMLRIGRFEQTLELSAEADKTAVALRALGRLDEAVAQGDARALAQADVGESALEHARTLQDRLYLLQYLALRAFFAGDVETYRRYRDQSATLPCGAYWDDVWVHRHLLFPLADELAGEAGAFSRALRGSLEQTRQHWYGKLWQTATLVLGDSSEERFLAQPCRLFLEARLLFTRALRAEMLGERQSARAHYRAYLELPFLERSVDSVRRNPLIDRWAAFRESA